MAYQEELKDVRWQSKSNQIKKRDGNKCLNCGSKSYLQVHHRQYHFILKLNAFKKPWDYPSDVLITLCQSCHFSGHKYYKIPTLKI